MVRAALVVVVALSAVVAVRPASAANQAQLRAAIVASGDLGPGFALTAEGPLNIDAPSYQVQFVHAGAPYQYVTVILVDLSPYGAQIDDAAASVSDSALDSLIGPEGYIALPEDAPPDLGQDTERYTLHGTSNELPVGGDFISWRQGTVAVVMVSIAVGSPPSILDLARTQQARLAAAFGS